METIIIRNVADLETVLPRLVGYAPPAGSIILMNPTAQPVGIIRPEMVKDMHADPVGGCVDLAVFGGEPVVLITVGEQVADLDAVLGLIGSEVILRHHVNPYLFHGLPTRGEYVAANPTAFDEAYERATRVAAGLEERDER